MCGQIQGVILREVLNKSRYIYTAMIILTFARGCNERIPSIYIL